MGMTSVFGNYLTILIGVAIIPSVLSILIVFPLYETPKYLLVKSKDRKSATESIKFYLQIGIYFCIISEQEINRWKFIVFISGHELSLWIAALLIL